MLRLGNVLAEGGAHDLTDRTRAATAFGAASEAGIDLCRRLRATRTWPEAGAHGAVRQDVAGADDHAIDKPYSQTCVSLESLKTDDFSNP